MQKYRQPGRAIRRGPGHWPGAGPVGAGLVPRDQIITAFRHPCNRSSYGYTVPDRAALMRLAHPTHIRLSPAQIQALDRWRGDRMSRATAIRVLLDQSLKLHTRADEL